MKIPSPMAVAGPSCSAPIAARTASRSVLGGTTIAAVPELPVVADGALDDLDDARVVDQGQLPFPSWRTWTKRGLARHRPVEVERGTGLIVGVGVALGTATATINP